MFRSLEEDIEELIPSVEPDGELILVLACEEEAKKSCVVQHIISREEYTRQEMLNILYKFIL